jgi:hypothetical protein
MGRMSVLSGGLNGSTQHFILDEKMECRDESGVCWRKVAKIGLSSENRGEAFYATWYNFAGINTAVRTSPPIAARLTETLWDIGDIVKLIEH